MRLGVVFSLPALMLGVFGACSRTGLATGEGSLQVDATGGMTSGGAEAPLGSLEGLCRDSRAARCRFYESCWPEVFRDHDQCLAELDCYGVDTLKRAIDSGRIGYDEDEVRQCFERLAENPCSVPVAGTLLNDIFGVDRILRSCPGAIEPRQGEGDECYAQGECLFGHTCVLEGTDDGCPGHCARVPGAREPCREGGICYHPQACLDGICRLLASEGDPCESPLDCREDLDCSPNGRCVMVERAQLGEPCIQDFNGAKPARLCREGLFCFPEKDREGTCHPLAAEGERCLGDWTCLPGHFCAKLGDSDEILCHRVGGVGAPCGEGAWCQEGLRCAGAPAPAAQFLTCSLPRTLGEPCSVVGVRTVCADGLVCTGTRCAKALFEGDPCGQDLDWCVRGECVAGRCRGMSQLGEGCENGDDCLSRECRGGRCVDPTVCLGRD